MDNENASLHGAYGVLYVDDEEMALKYFRRSVGRDVTVYTAPGVDTALDVLAEYGESIGVLITDQRMPGKSGTELLKKVRADYPNIVRLLTTAYADLDEAIEAVNRGEIFRYITKPWDVKALRAEIGQALNVFHLQYERAQLMREKLSVWQRLVQVGRVRDLIVFGHSLTQVRHSDNAVAAYLTDHLVGSHEPDDAASSKYLDLWSLTESEISQTLDLVHDIIARLEQLTNGETTFDTQWSADELLQAGGEAFASANVSSDDSLPDIRVADQAAKLLLRELASAAGHPESGIEIGPASDNTGVQIAMPVRAENDATPNDLNSGPAAGVLTAYLIAFHHGGSLKLDGSVDQRKYVLTLPAQPSDVTLAPPRAGWLDSLLVRLEGWD